MAFLGAAERETLRCAAAVGLGVHEDVSCPGVAAWGERVEVGRCVWGGGEGGCEKGAACEQCEEGGDAHFEWGRFGD